MDLADGLLRDYRVNARRSIRDAQRSVQHLGTMFADMRAIDIDAKRIQTYIDGRLRDHGPTGQPITPATINRELAMLRRMFSIARATRRGFPHRPHIQLLVEDNARQGFSEPAEFEIIAANLAPDLADYTRFAYLSGWRKSEVSTLLPSDVEWRGQKQSEGVMRLRREHSKNKKPRTLPLEGELLAIVQRRWKLRRPDCKYLFHREGRPIRDFRKAWKNACVAAGAEGRLFHDLRRSTVRNLVRSGVPERIAMEITGHRTRSVFDRYNIVSENDLANAARRSGDYVKREGEKNRTVVPLRAPAKDV